MKRLLLFFFGLATFTAFAQNDSLQIKIYDLYIDQPEAETGKTIPFSFKIRNTGTDTFPADLDYYCKMEAWLSKDSIVDENDRLISYFPYQLLIPGEEFVFHALIYFPNSILPGKYTVIINSDYGTCFTGYEEDKILLYKGLEVTPFTGFPCTYTIATGTLDCTSYLPDGSFHIITREGATYKSYNIDTTGSVSANPDPMLPESFSLLIQQNAVVKKNGGGDVVYTKTIPADLLTAYNKLATVIEFGNGYLIGAFKNAPYYPVPFAPNTADLELTLIKTDDAFNVLSTKVWNTRNEAAPFLYRFDDQQFAMGYSYIGGGLAKGYLLILDQSLSVTSTYLLIENVS